MKTIGICIATIEGGVVCHQEIGREAARRGVPYPEIATHTPLYETVDRAVLHEQFDALTDTLIQSIKRTAWAGADFAIIPSNTMHIVYDAVSAGVDIPILSIIDATADYCQRRGFKNVGVLGTRPTMRRRLYDESLSRRDIGVRYPDQSDQDYLARVISDELVPGIFLEATKSRLEGIARSFGNDVDAVILGCTELPLAMTEAGCGVALVDTTRLLSHAALDLALAG